mmetsp:Transcript_9903/g.24396  ORF Transcript_9903/g.24396 Transcript_9903/m.24396 type:complete len:430 (-) Transcript_9903:872-2161(-)
MTALASGEAYGSVDFAAGAEIQVGAVGAADGVGNLGAKQGGLGRGTQQAPGGARRWIPSAVVRSVLITGFVVGAFTVYAHGSYWNVAEMGEDCDNRCPTVDLVAHPFDKPSDAPRSEDAGAHLFIVGDSTNKLLHTSFCNQDLPAEEQCAYVCPTPNPEQYPITVMPFMAGYEEICPDCDAKGTPCCSLDNSQCCVDLTTIRTAIACRPRSYTSGAGSVGFLMVVGSHPTAPYYQTDLSAYQGYSLPLDTSTRIDKALPDFIAWVERGEEASVRPVVTLLNSCTWTIFKFGGSEPVLTLEAIQDSALVEEFEADMEAMATQVMGIYAANHHPESAQCVVFQTNPQGTDYYPPMAPLVPLMTTLNEAIVRVGAKMNIPVFDMNEVASSFAASGTAFLKDGFHPTFDLTMEAASLFKVWANNNLQAHCALH